MTDRISAISYAGRCSNRGFGPNRLEARALRLASGHLGCRGFLGSAGAVDKYEDFVTERISVARRGRIGGYISASLEGLKISSSNYPAADYAPQQPNPLFGIYH